MASTVNNMQKMLNEVTKFGQSHQIKFNPTKTSLLVYNPKTEDETVSFLLCDQQIIKADLVKKLLTIQNSYLRRQKLNEYLYFSNFIKQ